MFITLTALLSVDEVMVSITRETVPPSDVDEDSEPIICDGP